MDYFILLAFSLWVFAFVLRHLPHEQGWSGDDRDEPEL